MIPESTLLFVGLDALCLLLYLRRRRRRLEQKRPKLNYFGLSSEY